MKRCIAVIVAAVALSAPVPAAHAAEPARIEPAAISVQPAPGGGSASPQAVCRVFPRVCQW